MAGDITPSIDVTAAREIAARLADLDVLWLEEPLIGTDLRGLASLRASGLGIRIAGGEMTRTHHEALAALEADAFDVYQQDVVLAGGMLRNRTLAELALARGRWFTPHTWTNGLGLLANLHVAAGVGGGPFLEFPYDPPGLDPGATRCVPRRADPTGCGGDPARPGDARPGGRPRRRLDPEVRRMTATSAYDRRLDRPGGRGRAAQRGVHRRPVRAGRIGPDVRRRRRTRRARHHARRGGRGRGRRSCGRRRASRVRRSALGRHVARQAQDHPAASWPSRSAPTRDELALLESLDVGKPIRDALAVDVPSAAKTIQWFAETIDKLYGEVGPTGPEALSLVTREPIGVVGAIVPWNYPLIVTAWKLGAALSTGNSVVLKPASAVAADRAAAGRARVGGRAPGRRAQRRPGPGRGAGRGAGAASRRRQDRVHRLDRGRSVAAPGDRRDRRQGHLAGARRQEPAGRAGRRRRPRSGGVGHRLGHLLQQRPDLQRGLAAGRPSIDPRGARRADRRPRPAARPRRAARPGDAARLDRRRETARQGPRLRRARAAGGSAAGGRRASASARTAAATTSRRRSSTASTTAGAWRARRSSARS